MSRAGTIIQNSSDEIDIEHEDWKAKRREALDADSKRLLNPGADPRLIAVAMMKARRSSSASVHGFNDKLVYPKVRF